MAAILLALWPAVGGAATCLATAPICADDAPARMLTTWCRLTRPATEQMRCTGLSLDGVASHRLFAAIGAALDDPLTPPGPQALADGAALRQAARDGTGPVLAAPLAGPPDTGAESPPTRNARLRARAEASQACEAWGPARDRAAPLDLLPVVAPAGADPARIRLAFETEAGLFPVFTQAEGQGLAVRVPLHPAGVSGGDGRLHLGWTDAASGDAYACAPRPLRITAAVAPPGAWDTMLDRLAEDAAAVEALRPGGTGTGEASVAAMIGDLRDTAAAAPPEARAILDLWADRAGPQADRARLPRPDDATVTGIADLPPLPRPPGPPAPAPDDPAVAALCPDTPEEYLQRLNALAWANAHMDGDVQMLFTAGTTLGGLSAGYLAGQFNPKAGLHLENAIGAAAGLTNLLASMAQGLIPGRVLRLDARLSRDDSFEDSTDPRVALSVPVLHLQSKGWQPGRAALDLAIIGAQVRGHALPGAAVAAGVTRRLVGRNADDLIKGALAVTTGPDAIPWRRFYDTPQGQDLARTLASDLALGTAFKPLAAFLDNEIVNAAWGQGAKAATPTEVRITCRLRDPEFRLTRHEVDPDLGVLQSLAPGDPFAPYVAQRPGIGTVRLRLREEVPIRLSGRPDLRLPHLVHDARLYLLAADDAIQPGETATVTVDAQLLAHPADITWTVTGTAVADVNDLPPDITQGHGVMIETRADAPQEPILVEAELNGLTLPGSTPERLTHVIHIGDLVAEVSPRCAWKGAQVAVTLRIGTDGRRRDPADFDWSVSDGGSILVPGRILVREKGEPLLVTARPKSGGPGVATLVRRDCACDRSLFQGLMIEEEPYARTARRWFQSDYFALVGEGSWRIDGDAATAGVEPGMRLSVLTMQGDDYSCTVTTAPTLAGRGLVGALATQDIAGFVRDSLNIFEDAIGFDIAAEGARFSPRAGFDGTVPYRGAPLQTRFHGPGELIVTSGPGRLRVDYTVAGRAEPTVDRGWPHRRTNLYDTPTFLADYHASFTAYPETSSP